jgi:hypothetical protein
MNMKGKDTFGFVKKIAGVALIMAGCLSTAQAQDRPAAYFGICGGPQFGNISSDNAVYNYKGNVTYHAGLTGEFHFNEHIGIGLDLLYSNVTATNNSTRDSLDLDDRYIVRTFDIKESFSYAQAHILFKYFIPLGSNPIIPYDRPDAASRIFLTLYAGPYFATLPGTSGYKRSGTSYEYNVSHLGDTATIGVAKGDLSEQNKKYYIQPMDIGATVGIGLNFKLGESTIFSVDARYSRGLVSSIDYSPNKNYRSLYGTTTFNEKDNTISFAEAQVHPSAIALSIGLKFRIFHKVL